MIFTPNTSIYLLTVPFDATQDNQIDFASLAAQQAYFNTKIIKSFLSCTYQRQDGTIRVDANVETLYNCNYVMYQNSNYGSRWFYAFIIGMDYLTNGSTTIKIETDVYQTWLFDCTLHQSFVVREHVNDDDIGVHTVPENLNIGNYIPNGAKQACGLAPMDIVVASMGKFDGTYVDADEMFNNIYSGLLLSVTRDPALVGDMVEIYRKATKLAEIVAIFMVPHIFTNGSSVAISELSPSNVDNNIPITLSSVPTSLNGYTPRNKKLLSYPYSYLYVHNNNGKGIDYRYENFLGTPEFEIIGAICPGGEFKLFPVNLNVGGTEMSDYDQAISLDGFPVCLFGGEVYTGWLNRNRISNTLAIAGGAAGIAAGAYTGNVTAAAGGAFSILSTLAKMNEHSFDPAQSKGSFSANANASAIINDFYLQPKSIRAEYAQIIDEYFDMFGYAVNRLKIPNTVSRPVHNYIKTIDVNIEGDIPFDDMSRLKKIYNDGFTVWHNPVNFGNYSLDNAVVGD